MTASLTNAIPSSFLERLGRIVAMWAVVEYQLNELVALMVRADPGLMNAVTQFSSSSSIVKSLRILADILVKDANTSERLSNLFFRIDDARSDRNSYVHGVWQPGSEPGTAIVMTIKFDRAEMIKNQLVTTSDLDHLLQEIEGLLPELVLVANSLKATRTKA